MSWSIIHGSHSTHGDESSDPSTTTSEFVVKRGEKHRIQLRVEVKEKKYQKGRLDGRVGGNGC